MLVGYLYKGSQHSTAMFQPYATYTVNKRLVQFLNSAKYSYGKGCATWLVGKTVNVWLTEDGQYMYTLAS